MKGSDHMFQSIDVHGFTTQEVKSYLDQTLSQIPKGTREITIIHGYQSGQALGNFLRKQYRHPKIERKLLSMNPGETTFVLYCKEKKRG